MPKRNFIRRWLDHKSIHRTIKLFAVKEKGVRFTCWRCGNTYEYTGSYIITGKNEGVKHDV